MENAKSKAHTRTVNSWNQSSNLQIVKFSWNQTWNKVCAFELQFDEMKLNEMQQVHCNKGVAKLGHIGVLP